MPCYYPIPAWRHPVRNPETGKRPITFRLSEGMPDRPIVVRCGQCIGCRLEYSREWAVRCVHEASMWQRNCFVTLTFNEEHCPKDKSLRVATFQEFMKRLRERYRNHGKGRVGIRHFGCGEYGSENLRPHYHVLLFNHDFEDKWHFKTHKGNPLYRSPELEELWQYGYSSVGALSFNSAAYVARYMLKKQKVSSEENGNMRYAWLDHATGKVYGRAPEFSTMSRGGRKDGLGGIGLPWIKKWLYDVYPADRVVLDTQPMKPPRFYDEYLESVDPLMWETVYKRRLAAADGELSSSRDRVCETIRHRRIEQLTRPLSSNDYRSLVQ